MVSNREIDGRLDVEHEQRHRHGEDAVGERLDPVLGEAAVVEHRRWCDVSLTHALPSPSETGAVPKRAAKSGGAIGAAVELERQHVQQAAASAVGDELPSRTASVGASVGGAPPSAIARAQEARAHRRRRR